MNRLIPAVILLFLLTPSMLQAETIHVPGNYPTIQQAVDAAADGDVILVDHGTYDGVVVEDVSITIRSEDGPDHCRISHSGVGIQLNYGTLILEGFFITGDGAGVGVINDGGTISITNCMISGNWEGGIRSLYGNTTISGCEISYNANILFGGGGLHAWGSFTAENCLFRNNATYYNPADDQYGGEGGAIWCTFSSPTISNCTFYDNFASLAGGAIASSENHAPAAEHPGEYPAPLYTLAVDNCIFWGNYGPTGDELYTVQSAQLDIRYSDVDGGAASAHGNVSWGEGMIDADPLFVSGEPGRDYYLSQTAAGQPVDSPCVDAGNPGTPLFGGTTRTDHVEDDGVIDLGWHYDQPPEWEGPFLVTGPGPAESNPPRGRVFVPEQDGVRTAQFSAYGASSFGVNVATGDINGDGGDSIITGAGPGEIYGPHVRGFTPYGSAISEINFLAYGTNKYGVNVVCGDLTGSGRDEIITGAGPGAVFGPHVRAFTNTGTALEPMSGVNFFAYGTPKWGANVAAGDIDGDGFDEIVTGPGPGNIYGPHVRGWNVDNGTATAIPAVSYFAYGTFKKGVRVSCGDVDGDGVDEIVTGPGPSGVFGAHVRGWNYDGGTVTDIPGINFFAWPVEESLFGATVMSGVDLDSDGRDEIITGQGPDPAAGTVVQVYSYDGSQTSLLFDLDAYGDIGLTHGVNVAAGRY